MKPRLQKITDIISNRLVLGKIENIEFSLLADGTYWLVNGIGEGTQVDKEVMRSKMDELFNSLF